MEIGRRIRTLRSEKGITQETLAAALRVSPQAVSKWECDSTTPDIQLLPELAVYFGVTVDELFGLTDDREFDRIQNMLWDRRELTPAEIQRAQSWCLERAAAGYRPAACYRLLADLYNHQAKAFHDRAAEYAMQALEIDPEDRDAYSELNEAMGGYIPDWCVRNHHKLIDCYKSIVAAHPKLRRPYLWLLDNLLADHRFREAEEYVEQMARTDDTFRTPLYRGLIAWHQGDKAKAHGIWEEMLDRFPEEWMVCLSLGDVMAEETRYEEAIGYYRRGLELQKAPRFVDSLESIAHVCEISGDVPGAIDAYEQEIRILAEEWNTKVGETVDVVRREIRRLKQMIAAKE